ncbi:MAG: hypothetical protein ACOCRD_00220 [Halorubrum sp.]
MESTANDAKYHVVCRECSVERLVETRDDAAAEKRDHAAETDHRIVVGRVR